jgi:hypothetical protein
MFPRQTIGIFSVKETSHQIDARGHIERWWGPVSTQAAEAHRFRKGQFQLPLPTLTAESSRLARRDERRRGNHATENET